MPLPEPLPPCRAIVIAAADASTGAVASTLASLLEDPGLDGPVLLFGDSPPAFAEHPSVRRFGAATGLAQALAMLEPLRRPRRADSRTTPATPGPSGPAGRAAEASEGSEASEAAEASEASEASEAAVADAAASIDGCDLAWVFAGTRVPEGGLRRLQAALHAEPRIGTVSPLCAADPLYSPVEGGRDLPAGEEALDDWLSEHAPDAPVELPSPLACCGVLRGTLAPTVAACAAHDDWARAIGHAGYVHAASARVLVACDAPVPARSRDSSLLGERRVWQASHPLTGLRWKLAKAAEISDRGRSGVDAPGRPGDAAAAAGAEHAGAKSAAPAAVRLHVAHSWGGGLSGWVKDFCDGDEGAENLVLRSIGVVGAYGQRLALYRGSESVEPLRIWELGVPIHASAIAHLQYRAVLREIADDFGIDCVIVSSLIGHSLDALRTGLPTLLVAHDHYPFCIAIFAYHGGECRSCDSAKLSDCIAHNPGHRFFRGAEASDWLALRGAFCEAVLGHGVTIVAPSPSVALRWRALMPALSGARVEIVAHGVSLAPAVAFEPPSDGPLRLVVIGRLSMEKGGEILEAMLPELARFARLTLLGCGDEGMRLGRRPGVTAIASFSRAELPALIAQTRPHLGLQLSVVPETYSYTLSELWHCGVPVLGCALGSLADRIRDGENGWLVAPDATAILAKLRGIASARDAIAPVRERVLESATRSRADMVADYRALLPGTRSRRVRRASAATSSAGRDTRQIALGPISVDPEVTYLQAARAFLRYTAVKAAHSPRLPRAIRRMLGGR